MYAIENLLQIFHHHTSPGAVSGRHLGNDHQLTNAHNSGGFGKDRLGFDRKSGNKLAVKISFADDKYSFWGKVQALKKLVDHTNVAKLFSGEVIDRKAYLIIEYTSGGDLFDYVENHHPLPEMKVKYIFRQLVLAIKVSAHIDLKANMLTFE